MNPIYFIFIQIIGIVAWVLLILSYYRKNTNKILVFQIIGTFLYVVHYYLLSAYSGMLICTFETLRDLSYYKTDYDDKIFLCSLPIYAAFGYFSYTSFIDILPIFSSVIDGYSLTKKKRFVVLGGFIEYTLWVIYDIAVLSISGAITDGLIALSNLSILIFKKNIFSNTKLYKIICK